VTCSGVCAGCIYGTISETLAKLAVSNFTYHET